MKFPKEDFPLIRTAVILLVASTILSVIGIAASIYFNNVMQQDKNEEQKRLAEARAQLEQAHVEEQQIQLYHAKYLKLVDRGILDKEDRLQWIERIAQIKENRKLFGLDYQIDAQQAVQVESAIPQGAIALYGSTLKLGFSLLHEEDLLNALNDLKKSNRQIGLLRECTLTRMDESAASLGPRLRAECTLAWLSFKPKGSAETP